MIKNDFDAAIIGGGPAGSVSGINLARAGISTAIIERKIFPRDTLCGEFLSYEVSKHLRELNLFEKFLLLNPNVVKSFKFITRKGNIFNTPLPFTAYSLKRSVFDNFLLNEAREAGALILQPAEVSDISRDNGIFKLHVKNYGEGQTITSGIVIGAYGKSNILDKKLQRDFSSNRSGFNGIKFHINKELLSEIDESVIYIFSGHNIYCGINAVSNDEAAVCFLYKKSNLNETPSEKFNELLNENRRFAAMFKNNISINKMNLYGAGNIYLGKRGLIKNGIIMIGDAAGMIAPVAGDGIGMAFQSARTAAGIIQNHLSDNDLEKVHSLYRDEWKNLFSKRIFISRFIQSTILKNLPEKLPVITRLLLPSSVLATRI